MRRLCELEAGCAYWCCKKLGTNTTNSFRANSSVQEEELAYGLRTYSGSLSFLNKEKSHNWRFASKAALAVIDHNEARPNVSGLASLLPLGGFLTSNCHEVSGITGGAIANGKFAEFCLF